jgi:PAS domain S-box-containing protein
MMSKKENPSRISSEQVDSHTLRKQAEERAAGLDLSTSKVLTPDETQQMLHELHVQQIELEMQNEELLRTQQELVAERERYFELYELAPVGYITLSEQGLILESNLTFAGLLGEGRGELVKQPLSRFVLKEDQDIYYLHRKQLFESGEVQISELRMVKKDGTRFWAHMASTPAQSEDGAPGCRAVISDISERKQAEESLRVNEELYRFALDSTGQIVWSTPPDGAVEDMPSWRQYCGLSVEEIKGWKWLDTVHPDDRESVKKAWKNAVQKRESYYQNEYRIRRADGVYRNFLARSVPLLDADGSVRGWLGTCIDITERKQTEDALRQSEERFNLAISGTGAGLWDWDMVKDTVYYSPGWKSMLGYEDCEVENTFSGWKKLWHPDDAARIEQALNDYLEGETTRYEIEHRLRHKDGSWRWILTRGDIQRDAAGKPARWVGTNLDVTDRKRAEEALRESQEELLRSEARLKKAQTVARVGDWSWNIKDGQVEWSDEMYAIFGIDKNSYTGRLGDVIAKVIHPDDLHLVLPSNSSTFAEKKPVEYRILLPDGSIRYIWAESGESILDEAGNPIYLTGIAQDITERKLAEEALRESELSFRSLAENSGDYIMRYDHDHRHVYANQRAIQVSGKTSAEFIGKTHREMGFPEDLCALWESAIDRVFATGQPYGEIFKWEGSEGEIYLDWRLFPEMDLQGRVVFVLGVSRDITERLEAEQLLAISEEQFRTLASFASVGIYLTKPDGTCLYTNPTWQKMAGLSAEEALGMGWVNGIHPDDREMVFSNWQKMVESQGEWGLEYRFQNHEGKSTIVFGIATAQKDASGNIVGYIGINIDITERKQAEIFSKNLVSMNPVSIQVLDSNGFTLEVNPAFRLLFGSVPPADYSIFTDPQLAQKGVGKIFDQLRNGEVVHFPDVSFNPHDSIPELPDVPNWVRTIGFPICSENEKPERFVLMQENITEQKNAEVTLRESEFKFRQTFDVSPVGIVMVGLDTRFIQCNLAFAQSLGYEAQELVGKPIEDVTLPEDRAIGKAEMAAIKKGEIGKSQVQIRYLRKDGQIIWGEVTITLIRDSNGQALYFLAIIQNITERKLAEQKINEQLTELRRWHNITLGREDRIMELKREVNKLLEEAGKSPHYTSVE